MAKLNKNKTGLVLGLFFAVIHLVWALLVLIVPVTLQNFLNWVFKLHSLTPIYTITSFNLVNAVFLLIVTFVFGYILGYIFAVVWDKLVKK
jgi:tetrahydromethanopterin S-methyltransferase subunit F